MSGETEIPMKASKEGEQTTEIDRSNSSSRKTRKRARETSDNSTEPNKDMKLDQPLATGKPRVSSSTENSEFSDSSFYSSSSSALITGALSSKESKTELTLGDLFIPDSFSIPSEAKDQEKWEADEHKDIGDVAFELFCEVAERKALIGELTDTGLLEFQDNSFKLANGINITAGQIVALAGDFYGIPNKPIAFGKDSKEEDSKEERFKAAYETLPEAASQKPAEVKALLAETLKRPDKSSDCRFFRITQSGSFSLSSRYTDLALQNFDHFQAQAREAYQAGHAVACATASRAATEKKKEDKYKLFVEALMQELFACHFLTDLGAAGHIRTPREELMQYVKARALPSTSGEVVLKVAGFLSKIMHDEDGAQGLQVVSNKRSTPWLATGDGSYFEKRNATNKEQVILAVQAGLEDIYRRYSVQPVKNDALAYVPHPVKEEKENSRTKKNHPALFRVRAGELEVRKDLTDQKCEEYTSDWEVETVYNFFIEKEKPFYLSKVKGKFAKLDKQELSKEEGLKPEQSETNPSSSCLCM